MADAKIPRSGEGQVLGGAPGQLVSPSRATARRRCYEEAHAGD